MRILWQLGLLPLLVLVVLPTVVPVPEVVLPWSGCRGLGLISRSGPAKTVG